MRLKDPLTLTIEGIAINQRKNMVRHISSQHQRQRPKFREDYPHPAE
jgi:hypothetical protein